MALPVIIILLILYCYTLLILLFYMEIEKEPDIKDETPEHPRHISLIIPFRNEAEHLPALIEDLAVQFYPAHMWELIFVDDHSEDDSASIIASAIADTPGFSYQRLSSGKSGKKAALYEGIQEAKHNWIMQVDADCRVGPGFISSHVMFLDRHPSDMVAGLVSTGKGKGSFMETFERLDMLALVGSSAGSFSLGRPMMCSGANLSYSRELYMETRSFDPEQSTASGDDMFLMIGGRKLNRTLRYNTSREALVETGAMKDLRTLIVQRMRWGSKTGLYRMPDIQLFALLVSLTNISILLMPLWMILFPGMWAWLAGAYIAKSLADFMLLFRITGITGSRADLKMFIPVSLMYYPVFLISMLGALLGKQAWKKSLR
jgi:poly-beta-1,6-N-acetyl-D-glucosamine synthase